MKPYLTLQEEIESVRRYLDRESAAHQGKLNHEFFLDPEVDSTTVIPRKLLQVFVENALRNGITGEYSEATIQISVNQSTLGILIMVADYGLRRGPGSAADLSQSEGMKILNSYLPLFNRQKRVSISYKILNLKQENGTPGARVLITLKPNKQGLP
jgi:LytS/YehU family sensor histidine kinase